MACACRSCRAFFFAFTPAWVIAVLVWLHGVNTPVWDDWERGPLLEKFYGGSLTFADLYAPHIDHRIFFPRLVILALNEWSGGNLRWEMAWTWLTALAAGIGVWRLALETSFGGATRWGAVFAANLIIFSPIQWDNWVWGIQLAFLMPMTCTIWALVISQSSWKWWVRLLACAALALVGTHSFGHGFAVWPAVLGVSLLSYRFTSTRKERFLFVGSWTALAAVVICFYALFNFENSSDTIHSYGQGAGQPPPSVVNKHQILEAPEQAAAFVATLAGNAFARFHLTDPLQVAPIIGCLLVVLFLVFAVHRLCRLPRERSRWDDALPWLALGGAALLGMAAIAIGRLNLAGLTRAASIRYVSISQYLAVAVLMLGVLWWRTGSLWQSKRRALWGPVVLASFCGFMVPAWIHGSRMMKLCEQARYQGHASLMFVNFWDPDAYWRIDGMMDFPRKYANLLNDRGLLNPPLAKSLDLAQFKPMHRDRPVNQAGVTSLTPLQREGLFKITGHAAIDGRPGDLVLFTWETKDMEPSIFAAAEPTTEMQQQFYPNDLELVGRKRPGRLDHCQWEDTLRLEDMGFMAFPAVNEVTLRCWVFDVKKLRAYRIKGAWQVSRGGAIRELEPPHASDMSLTQAE